MSDTKMIALNEIAVPIHRLRAVREESVNALVQSMADQGQLQPIVVRRGQWRRLLVGCRPPSPRGGEEAQLEGDQVQRVRRHGC